MMGMMTRECAQCGESKTIRGVWYLKPMEAEASAFFCESCFARETVLPRPSSVGSGNPPAPTLKGF